MDLPDLRVRAERWIADDVDPTTQDELRALLARPDLASTDVADRFATSLEFGTAGLRGLLGAGPNRMNRAVVARAAWAIGREVRLTVPRAAERVVVVGGDARWMSREFCDDIASVLSAIGLRVVLFPRPVPTPLVGFALRRLGAAAGVVVTASHNPRDYSGCKVYWENGAQIVPPIDARIAALIDQAPPARHVPRLSFDAARARGLLAPAPDTIDRDYLAAIAALSVHPTEGDRRIPIVYTPLHGVGGHHVVAALRAGGFSAVATVAEQDAPDPAFPTVAFPNPEEPGVMDHAFALAAKQGAELVLATDPDADRLAVAVLREGRYLQLTGNQVGVLLGHDLLSSRASERRRAVITSIVSSPMLGRIATAMGVHHEQTLTGFKWIANRAIELEAQGYEFVFGYEEAIGYSVGNVVRDKDGISAALLVAELAAVLRARGRTLWDELEDISRRWGAFASTQVNVVRPGASGIQAIRAAMDNLRTSPPLRLGDDEVVAVVDYVSRVRTDRAAGTATPLRLPSSLVVGLELASGARVTARPSGTEPKAKIYVDVCEPVGQIESPEAAMGRAAARAEAVATLFRAVVPL
jgi:phosphomannomutase